VDTWAVKRPTGRCWGFSIASFGLWTYFWFYTYRRLLDGELGDGRDDATLHTLGLLVPVLNFFVIHWLWRDLNELRGRVGLPPFSDVGYLVGAIFLAPVFFTLANGRLNEYWDARSQGHATDAPVTTTEKVVIGVGAALWLLWIVTVVLTILLAVLFASESSS
jgi:hypothetical protein